VEKEKKELATKRKK